MIYSMTGYGKSLVTHEQREISVEVKSVNGKNADVNLKIAPALKPYEIQIRKYIVDNLYRGSIELQISIKDNGTSRPLLLNKELAKKYYHSILEFCDEIQVNSGEILSTILKIPEVFISAQEEIDNSMFQKVMDTLTEACDALSHYRLEEGNHLSVYLEECLQSIEKFLLDSEQFENSRLNTIKQRIQKSYNELMGTVEMDRGRFETELFYYIEKLDVNEEKQRLKAHLNLFRDTVNDNSVLKGRKLNFITQEIGRELNTLGSKANQSEMQVAVVNMKDELEKIKEQVLNIL